MLELPRGADRSCEISVRAARWVVIEKSFSTYEIVAPDAFLNYLSTSHDIYLLQVH